MMFILARLTVNQQVGVHEDAEALHSGGLFYDHVMASI